MNTAFDSLTHKMQRAALGKTVDLVLLLPIKIPDSLPARAVLESENIFVMTEHRATTQRIRPLRIAILNLMPLKIVTETQILRCLSNTPIQIEVDLIQTKTYHSKNTPEDHRHYKKSWPLSPSP